MNGATGAIERIVDEVERALAAEIVLVAKRDHELVGKRTADAGALAREGQEIGFAHIEIDIERIERDQRRQQRGRAGRRAASRDQASERDLTRADAPRKGGREAAKFGM